MKICSHCGAAMADEYTVCTACGMVLPAPQPAPEAPQPAAEQPAAEAPYVPPVYVPPTNAPVSYAPAQLPKESVSMWGWVGRYALNLIPFVGGLVYLIMLFVWAFDSKYDDTSRNWAKAQLIIAGISVILVSVLFVLMLVLGFTLADVYSEAVYY